MKRKMPEKAYQNAEYLQNRQARPIRILAEYLYPLYVFEKEQVTDMVVFFGSARIFETKEKDTENKINEEKAKSSYSKYYHRARELSGEITRWSQRIAEPQGRHFVICTGGGPGIMEASNRGAYDAKGRSIGLNIELPKEQEPNPFITAELNFDFNYFFTRKYWFMYFARILIVFPGGFGTLDELFETLTLQQTKNIEQPIPVVLFGRAFWERLVDFNFLAETGMISHNDLKLFHIVDSVPEALDFILPFLNSLLE